MKKTNTYIITFKSGRIERVFAYSIKDLKKMVTFENALKIQKLEN